MIENRNREISLLGLFGKEMIEKLQKNMAEVTGFSFSTIDYRGEKVVAPCNQKYYQEYLFGCEDLLAEQMTEAFSAAKAAITNQPYLFECQSGLVKVAVPVVINKQYLGALIAGGVRCSDPDYQDPVTENELIHRDFKEDGIRNVSDMIPEYPAVKIQAVADMVYFLVQQMCQKESYALRLGDTEHKEIHLDDLRKKNQELRDQIKELELYTMKNNILPQLLLNMLVTISNMTILGEPAITQQILEVYAQYLRYYIEYNRDFLPLAQELKYIADYLEVLKLRYENRIQVEITTSAEDDSQMVPKLVMLPLLEYLLHFGLLSHGARGNIRIRTDYQGERCIIVLSFDHAEKMTNMMGYLNESGQVMDERQFLEQINLLEKRLNYEYAGKYSLSLDADMIVLNIPWIRGDGDNKMDYNRYS